MAFDEKELYAVVLGAFLHDIEKVGFPILNLEFSILNLALLDEGEILC